MAPIYFKSYKARRITRSVMAPEVISFRDMLDTAYTFSSEPKEILGGRTVPVKLFTDNKSLFEVFSKGSRTSEKSLMLASLQNILTSNYISIHAEQWVIRKVKGC